MNNLMIAPRFLSSSTPHDLALSEISRTTYDINDEAGIYYDVIQKLRATAALRVVANRFWDYELSLNPTVNVVNDEISLGKLHRLAYLTSIDIIEDRPGYAAVGFPLTVEQELCQLLAVHTLAPDNYKLDDGSTVFEFYTHPSFLVCVIAENFVHLMWKNDDGNHSKMYSDGNLSLRAITQQIALILQ